MDPQSLTFTPQSDVWRMTDTMKTLQQTQQEHAERLMRLERRQDEDARVKSVWGTTPFAGVFSGTPHQGPMTQASNVDFTSFDDDQSNSMVRSLHLDADDEPRPNVAASRANSVRFDDSTKPGQWAHAPRQSVDYLSRASSGLGGLGGHPMFERSISHKSDGRQSSGAQSASGRANSFGLESAQPFGQSPMEHPGLAPGLFILGSVPSIIRCWLNTNFKHDSLLYAAVCTGSHRSFLDVALIENLGFSGQIRHDITGSSKIKLPVYLPEAVPQPISSRSSSPAPQLPCVTVEFNVVDRNTDQSSSSAIQIFIGSDTLRAHNADILFSSNSMTMFDDDRSKLSIPLVRPENDETFKSLYITSAPLPSNKFPMSVAPGSGTPLGILRSSTNGVPAEQQFGEMRSSMRQDQRSLSPVPATTPVEEKTIETPAEAEATEKTTDEGQRHDRNPSLNPLNTAKADHKDPSEESPLMSSSSRNSSSPAIWGNWRRDGSAPNDWASVSRGTNSNYQRPTRDQGIKVLKPAGRQSSRSSAPNVSQSPVATASRFFDDGKRRTNTSNSGSDNGDAQQQQLRRSVSGDRGIVATKENTNSKTRSANPVGGASAFGWLNSTQK